MNDADLISAMSDLLYGGEFGLPFDLKKKEPEDLRTLRSLVDELHERFVIRPQVTPKHTKNASGLSVNENLRPSPAPVT